MISRPPTAHAATSWRRELAELEPARYGLSDGDPVAPEGLVSAPGVATVGQLVEHLQAAYCGRLSAQFTHCAVRRQACQYPAPGPDGWGLREAGSMTAGGEHTVTMFP